MIRYLLDTNVVSAAMREPFGSAANKIREVGEEAVSISIIVAAELRFGVAKRQSSRLAMTVEETISRFAVLPLTGPADRLYAQIRAQLEQSGRPIGNNDMWIAAHALALDCTLVTDNGREFARIEELKVENWLR